jgi:hypothetical protein
LPIQNALEHNAKADCQREKVPLCHQSMMAKVNDEVSREMAGGHFERETPSRLFIP